MRRWTEEYDSHIHPLYQHVYEALDAIASSLIRLRQQLGREFGVPLRVFDPDLELTLRQVIGIKFFRLNFWISFFESKRLADEKMLIRFGKTATRFRNSYPDPYDLESHAILFNATHKESNAAYQSAIESVYGTKSEQVSVEDLEKVKQMISQGAHTLAQLHDAVESMAKFIRDQFDINDLFEEIDFHYYDRD